VLTAKKKILPFERSTFNRACVDAVYLAPLLVRGSMLQNVVVGYEISGCDIAKLSSFAPNVSSTRSSVKSTGRRFNPSHCVTRCLPSSATNKLRCQAGIDQSTLCRFTSSTRVPALGSEWRTDETAWTHPADFGRREQGACRLWWRKPR
jgi:hypothetical protein